MSRIIIIARAVMAFALSLMLFAGGAGPAAAAPSEANPVTWTVLVGGESAVTMTSDGKMLASWEFMRFYPDTITINEGDTIVWKLNSMEPHTVTFPKPGDQPPALLIPEGGTSQRMLFNPLAAFPVGGPNYDGTAFTGSGQLGGDPQNPTQYKLTFTKAGTYSYVCTFHTMMTGKVIVQPAGSAYPKTQAQIDADAKALLAKDAAAAQSAEPAAKTVAAAKAGPNGTSTYQVKVGYGDSTLAYMRFSPQNVTIRAGDSIEFVQGDAETPHTVTLVSGGQEPALVLVEPQPSGPPKLVANPVVLAPAGGAVYSGKGYFNSGFLQGTKSPAPGPRSYTLAFDTPGTYEFFCVLHDNMGMSGIVTVLAKDAKLPSAGQGPNLGVVVSGLAGLGLLLIGAGIAARRLIQVRIR
jgi:plastocyanin